MRFGVWFGVLLLVSLACSGGPSDSVVEVTVLVPTSTTMASPQPSTTEAQSTTLVAPELEGVASHSEVAEAVRQALDGEWFEGLCPLAQPLAGTAPMGDGAHPLVVVDAGSVDMSEAADAMAGTGADLQVLLLTAASAITAGDTSNRISYPGSAEVRIPVDWLAPTYEDVELVVCVSFVRGDLLGSCDYQGDRAAEWYRRDVTLSFHEAASGRLVAEERIEGVRSLECPLFQSFDENQTTAARLGDPAEGTIILEVIARHAAGGP